ncbi:unnamed protein product [Cuscuta epithymum]|nr:unnamed protein product [Cuscuta epithymum]
MEPPKTPWRRSKGDGGGSFKEVAAEADASWSGAGDSLEVEVSGSIFQRWRRRFPEVAAAFSGGGGGISLDVAAASPWMWRRQQLPT